MNKSLKNVFSILIAFAMVVSTIAVQNINVYAADTNSNIEILGFQVQAAEGQTYVSFRTVVKAPKKGSSITAGGKTLKVKDFGTIYTLHPDTIMGEEKVEFDADEFTLLNASSKIERDPSASQLYPTYTGINHPDLTFGYINTEKSVLTSWNIADKDHTYYAITIQNMNETSDEMLKYAIQARAYVVATDESDNEYFVYGTNTVTTSVARIGYNIFTQGKAKNPYAYDFIFDNILHISAMESSPYYLSTKPLFGWNEHQYSKPGISAGGGATVDDLTM